jgi:hypothetical protein
MTSNRITCTALVLMLLSTGCKTRPVEIAKERFERQKPPIALVLAATA